MEVEIGRVTHYYNHLNVAVLRLTDSIKLGDKIHILGHVTDLTERVASVPLCGSSLVTMWRSRSMSLSASMTLSIELSKKPRNRILRECIAE